VARVVISGQLFGAAVSPTGVAFITNATTGTVARFALPAPTVTGTVAVGALPSSVAFNHAGNRAYVGNQDDGTVSIIDVGTNAVLATPAFGSGVLATAVAPGDTLLLVATDSRLYWLRLTDLAITDTLDTAPYSNALVVRDTLLYASIPFGGVVLEISIPSRQVLRTLAVGAAPQGLALASGNELYVANEAGYLQIWDLAANTQVDTVQLPGGGGFGIARNPDSGLLYVSTGYYSHDVHVIDPAARRLVRVIHTGGTPRRIGFLPGGNLGIVANEFGWVDFIR
jgi:YVTN family beta-propeller protein